LLLLFGDCYCRCCFDPLIVRAGDVKHGPLLLGISDEFFDVRRCDGTDRLSFLAQNENRKLMPDVSCSLLSHIYLNLSSMQCRFRSRSIDRIDK
jgi:hypothetical protein